MEETGNDETPDGAALSEGTEETISGASATETYSSTTAINNDSGHHNYTEPEMLYTHLMIDIEAFGKKLIHQSYLSGPCSLIHQQVIPVRNFTK
jgi:exodeoxyribonuclease VIII